jgi:hypothetical protein
MSTADKPTKETGMGINKRKVVHAKRQRAGSDRTSVPPVVSIPDSAGPTAGSAMLAELQATGFIGMWKDREDIGDSTEFVQRLREQIQARADRVTPAE